MPRENSFTDSEGRSLTPELEDELKESDAEEHDAPPRRSNVSQRPPALAYHASMKPGGSHRHDRPGSPAVASIVTSLKGPQDSCSRLPQHFRHELFDDHHTTHTNPKDRFRAAARKVIQMHRTSTILRRGYIGAEPGVDPRRSTAYVTYGHLRQKCVIDIVDYSPLRASSGRMTNAEFVSYLRDEKASYREPWARVRWINIGGISWDVISVLALKYGTCHNASAIDVLLST